MAKFKNDAMFRLCVRFTHEMHYATKCNIHPSFMSFYGYSTERRFKPIVIHVLYECKCIHMVGYFSSQQCFDNYIISITIVTISTNSISIINIISVIISITFFPSLNRF